MKKIIYLLLSFILLACGTRSTEKEKSKESEKASLNQVSEIKSNVATTTNESQISSKEENNSVSKESLQAVKENLTTEKSSDKSNFENNSEIEKIKEYYENGILKSERETSKNYSKLSQEKDYWKASAESLKEENSKILENSNLIYQQNLKLQSNNKALVELNRQSLSEWEKISLEFSNNTESKRDSWWLYVLIVTVAFGCGFYLRGKLSIKNQKFL